MIVLSTDTCIQHIDANPAVRRRGVHGPARTTCLVAAAVACVMWTSAARGDLFVNFNAEGDLAANFNHNLANLGVEADAVGVGATRGIMMSPPTTGAGDCYATSKSPLAFNQQGIKLSVSLFFHTQATIGMTGEDRVLELNLVPTDTTVITGAHVGIGGKLEFNESADTDDVRIEFRRSNADVANSRSDQGAVPQPLFDILPDTWYKATFAATHPGATGTVIPASFVLDQYNADGTAVATANVFSHSFDIPVDVNLQPFLAEPDVFGGFRPRNGARLYGALDNFETTATGGTPAGNANFDGVNGVNGNDFLIWQRGLGPNGQPNGDANSDGTVDHLDLAIWRGQFGSAAIGAAAAIPEPGTLGLVVVAALALLRRKK